MTADDSATLDLMIELARPERRVEACRRLAEHLGADEVVLLVNDPTLGQPIPALGTPQTIRGGRAWRRFVLQCSADGEYQAMVDLAGDAPRPATACCRAGAAIVLIGGPADSQALVVVRRQLPLLAALLCAEQQHRMLGAEVEIAKEAAARAQIVSAALEAARADATRLNGQLAEEHARKDEFLSMLAHELRNPLSGVLAAAQLLRLKGTGAPAGDRAVAVVERQARQLARLVDDLTDVARVNQGRIELKLERIDLRQAIENAVEANRHAFDAKNNLLDIQLGDQPLLVRGDSARLTQVFSNLLHNASKYTDPGGRITVELRQEGQTAVVRVADNGIGISEDMLPLVFEMFKQAPVAIARSQGGLGMGLTLVRKLLAMHNGSVEAHSDGKGRGSCFTVRLPLDLNAAEESPSEASGTGPQQRPLRVMVVDDNHDAADSVAELIVAMGHQVEVAHSGNEALDVLGYQPLDLLILDLGLPDIDGFSLARTARSRRGDTLRIVALTGYDGSEIRRASADAGFDAHFVKPCSRATLDAIVGSAAPG
ncbi:ATP-binding protein [Piscinibacter sakaiensis]|uniref:hybrid sensor histidine kinase/response regulator n=1 Tax=Piscinibacter sakaiensis TaxID=1547922 RepID=UPI003AACD662